MGEVIAEQIPDTQCPVQGDRRIGWREFDRRANGVARALLDTGVVEQDKVAQYLYNCPEYTESMFAAFKAGPVPIGTDCGSPGRSGCRRARSCTARACPRSSSACRWVAAR